MRFLTRIGKLMKIRFCNHPSSSPLSRPLRHRPNVKTVLAERKSNSPSGADDLINFPFENSAIRIVRLRRSGKIVTNRDDAFRRTA